jgi:hypothetical protein
VHVVHKCRELWYYTSQHNVVFLPIYSTYKWLTLEPIKAIITPLRYRYIQSIYIFWHVHIPIQLPAMCHLSIFSLPEHNLSFWDPPPVTCRRTPTTLSLNNISGISDCNLIKLNRNDPRVCPLKFLQKFSGLLLSDGLLVFYVQLWIRTTYNIKGIKIFCMMHGLVTNTRIRILVINLLHKQQSGLRWGPLGHWSTCFSNHRFLEHNCHFQNSWLAHSGIWTYMSCTFFAVLYVYVFYLDQFL